MRKLSLLFLLLLFTQCSHAATWYATSSSVNINAVGLWVPTTTGSCTGSGTALIFGAQANGDVFDANGCTALAINVDPGSVIVQVTLETNATNGGGFTLTMANLATMVTLHANITATKTPVVVLSGATASVSGTISGNMTGGSASASEALDDTHSATSSTVIISGNATGGSGTTSYGVLANGAGPTTITGAVTGGSVGGAYGLLVNSTETVTVSGSCVGNNTNFGLYGCSTGASGTLIVTGNLINGIESAAGFGKVFFSPASSTNYILSPKNSSYTLGVVNANATEMPVAPSQSNVLAGTTYGTFTGTYTAPTGGSGVSATGNW